MNDRIVESGAAGASGSGEPVSVRRVDTTLSLSPHNSFTRIIRENLDAEYPFHIDDGCERRNFPVLAELYDGSASLRTEAVNAERQMLSDNRLVRYISLLEAAVGITRLAGESYKASGNAGTLYGRTFFPDDLSPMVGNAVNTI